LWGASAPAGAEKDAVLDRVDDGLDRLRAWRAAGGPAVDEFV
jgi:hypothetical protein